MQCVTIAPRPSSALRRPAAPHSANLQRRAGLSAGWGAGASVRVSVKAALPGPEPAVDQAADKETAEAQQQVDVEKMYTDVRKLFEDLPSAVATALSQAQQQQLTSLALENLELRLESKLASKDEVKEVKDELNRNFSVLGVVVSLFAYFAMFK